MRRTARLRGRAGGFVRGEEGGREDWRREGEEIESYEEELIKGAYCEEHVLFVQKNQHVTSRATTPCADKVETCLIRIVKMEQLRSVLVDLLMTHSSPRHR